jgi:hypothetical protein
MDGRREDIPEPLRSEGRRSEGLRVDMVDEGGGRVGKHLRGLE